MSLMTRAVGAFALLSLAAIPVGALTIKNTSSKDVSVGVDNGSTEAVYQIPAGGTVDVREDCSADCAVTGPWGYSRLVPQNATIETDGTSLVTAEAAPKAQSLVPQNPVSEPQEIESAATAEPPPAVAKRPVVKRKRPKPQRSVAKQAPKGPSPGSFQILFQGPAKKK
ncbi:hypothetical protein [Hyphomicrobium sp.]|uniref:hypothetical protein n=1 Tax=Hyphomicrobium sp. TaxID=82 RepID=UPI0025C6BF66|nr:hypothetical protein [Hyphomicrobium sp.]MCC7250364.1 hypothetical protein [Hyphomicrobium sp.]